MARFMHHFASAGAQVGAIPVFCDRGRIIEAVADLHRTDGISLNLAYCTAHIVRNVGAILVYRV